MNRHERRRREKTQRRVRTAAPDRKELFDRAAAMQRAGKNAEAETLYRSLLDRDPADAQALWRYALLKAAGGHTGEGRALLEKAVTADPGFLYAFNDLGVVCRRDGDPAAAETAYRSALAIDPEHVDTLYNFANLLADTDRKEEAEPLYRRALSHRPTHVGALNNLGRLLLDRDRTEEATGLFRRALSCDDTQPQTHNNLGNALKAAGSLEEAVEAYRTSVTIEPSFGDGWRNLSVVLQQMNRMEDAALPAQRAAALRPDDPETHLNLGTVMMRTGRMSEGRAALEAALALKPDYPEAHWNRSHWHLLHGEFRAGWAEYEWRLKCPGLNSYGRSFDVPLWDGGPLDGRTIYIHWEQGFSDTIQFVRFLPLVKARGGRVVFECQAALANLFETLPGVDLLVTPEDNYVEFDCYAALLSLPHLLGTGLDSIPPTPYLSPPRSGGLHLPEEETAGRRALRVGLVWAGRPAHGNDRNRSISLDALGPLFDVPGCRFYSLQLGEARTQISPAGLEDSLIDLSGGLTDFLQTATIIGSLDLVIAVDTAVAHLAGAVGRPVWVLLPRVPDWRWMLGRDDTPWYRTMRLFRQAEAGCWEMPVAAIASALQTEAGKLNDAETEGP
jgi:tetratricopeptide (TPR) repeat protein